jgi:stage II sporulation protein E
MYNMRSGNSSNEKWTSLLQSKLQRMYKRMAETKPIQAVIASKWTWLLSIMAFLLGRAMIFEQLSPFAVAFFAVVYFTRKESLFWVGCSLFLGSLWSADPQSGYILAEMAVFYCFQKALEGFERSELSYAPLTVFFATFVVKLFAYAVQSGVSWYHLMMTVVESSLSLILTLIFIQALPVLTMSRKNHRIRHEEIICLIILLASVMTGTMGWAVSGVSFEHVLSRYLILLFALVGGAPMGASIGVVTGLILSLSDVQALAQMSVLAFSGLLAGLLKEGQKKGVAIGLLIGSTILAMYVGTQQELTQSVWESAVAVAMFLLTPRTWIHSLSRFIPGTQEFAKTQHDYARRVRDITADRVEQFSEVFRQLAVSFKQFAHEGEAINRDEDVGHFMNEVARKSCTTCWKRKQCWDEKFYRTYKFMAEMMGAIEDQPAISKKDIRGDWRQACAKTEQVMELMKHQYDKYKHDLHWKKQIYDSRRLVADQLSGVSQVMMDLAREIKREGQELYLQEEQIRSALEQLGLSIHSIEVINLDEGNVEIEIVHQYTKGYDECRKIIAPLLSDILGENIVVKQEQYSSKGEGFSNVSFGSAKEYEVETGIAGAAKGGGLLSGDSFNITELGNGKFAVAVSDGMGNGERAKLESSSALAMLQQFLQSGMDERLAIKSVNSVLLLRSADEFFTTIDLALIDLYTAKTTFLKIGSIPSFIKRGGEVIPITGNNLPVGILANIDVDLITHQLLPGDILILMTDGIYDTPGPAVNKEMWMKRIIQEVVAETPQDIADCLLETIVRYHQGEITDDMTVVVAKIEKYRPEWSTVRWQVLPRIERPKTVS